MRFKKNSENRVYYIIIAVLCFFILFLGFKIIKKICVNNIENVMDSSLIEKNEEVATAFLNIDSNKTDIAVDEINEEKENEEKENKKESKKNIENFYLRVLLNSNSFMQISYEINNGCVNDFSIIGPSLPKMYGNIQLSDYLKSQFPAILNIFSGNEVKSEAFSIFGEEDSNSIQCYEGTSNEEGSKNGNESVILKDIILVEDPVEADEGVYIYEQSLEQNGVDISVNAFKIAQSLNINTVKVDESNPFVLIYHTHGTEAFLPIREGNFHTTKKEYNVLTIGDIITDSLNDMGKNIKHVDTYHDIPSYNQSYTRSLATVTSILRTDKNIKIIFDIHRDGVEIGTENDKVNEERFNTVINGKEVATFSMVIGPENPNKDELIKFAKYLKAVSDSMYPGLCRGIIVKPYGKFNQYISDYYALIEVGSNINTIDEAKETSKMIAQVLNYSIEGIIE